MYRARLTPVDRLDIPYAADADVRAASAVLAWTGTSRCLLTDGNSLSLWMIRPGRRLQDAGPV
jgi:hypothetical protein